jgi:hypothetical protein
MREASAEKDNHMTTAETTITDKAASVAAQGAHVAPKKAPAKKGASQKNGAPKGQKSAKGAKQGAKAKATPKKTAKAGSLFIPGDAGLTKWPVDFVRTASAFPGS